MCIGVRDQFLDFNRRILLLPTMNSVQPEPWKLKEDLNNCFIVFLQRLLVEKHFELCLVDTKPLE